MTEHQKKNIPANGFEVSSDHDEYQYLKSIKNIIENGKLVFFLLLQKFFTICTYHFSNI